MKNKWSTLIGNPTNYDFEHTAKLIKKINTADFDGEIYEQANGIGTFQKTLLMLPKQINGKLSGVVVPFYYPDKSAGYNLDTLEPLDDRGNAIALYLVRRGYAVITAESYHLTYIDTDLDRDDFSRWRFAGEKLLNNHPEWTGIGKLIADTKLLVDMLTTDARINNANIGIAGHSLGGKIALYNGCLDNRIKVMLCSDFGIEWDSTNWSDIWYWGDKLQKIKESETDHSELLQIGGLKPIVFMAGLYDNEESLKMLKRAGYSDSETYLFINHATGHRPPFDVLEKSIDFIDKFLLI